MTVQAACEEGIFFSVLLGSTREQLKIELSSSLTGIVSAGQDLKDCKVVPTAEKQETYKNF